MIPTLLLILDGWGLAPDGPGNAITRTRTPNLDLIQSTYPSTELRCSGRAVGLPEGYMGNSEVGHVNIGAGRVVYQDMTRIDVAIEDGSLARNETLLDLLARAKAGSGRIHFLGLLSDGGVHSHIGHLKALLELAKAQGVEAFVHVFLDGRDTPPTSGKGYTAQLLDFMRQLGHGRVATISGRYWAMDRDKRWERNEQAYNAMVHGQGAQALDPLESIQQAYDAGETDEFVKPRVLMENGKPVGSIADGDAVFFFNFRADRARQIVSALFRDEFPHFDRGARPELAGLATMNEYDQTFGLPVAFPPQSIRNTLGEIVSNLGLRQLRLAETEKYAHVTYFLNGGREEPYPGEDRVMIPSPRDVATYDLKPEMSVREVTETALEKWKEGVYQLMVVNLANLDMVGHTGSIPAVTKAIEEVDACVGRLAGAVIESKGRLLLTADHGNADEMLDDKGQPQTAHSKNPVPLVLVESGCQGRKPRPEGKLADIAPTILKLWGIEQPAEMTGQSLLLEDDNG